jgi:hypothetical protein
MFFSLSIIELTAASLKVSVSFEVRATLGSSGLLIFQLESSIVK